MTNDMTYTAGHEASPVTNFFNTTADARGVTEPFVGKPINPTAKIIFLIVSLLEVVCGVAGNVLLLSALLVLGVDSYHLLFIANLAVSDLLAVGYWMPFFVLDLILGYHPVVNQAHCQANSFVVYACSAVSILSLISISLNRYLHVCHNHLYSRVFNRPRIIIWCLMLWLLAAAVSTPPLVGTGSYDFDPLSHTCSSITDNSKNLYVNTVITCFVSLSVVLVGYCNFAIFRYWKRFKLDLDRRYPLSPKIRGKTTRVKRKQGGSEEETELDTLQESQPKELDTNKLQTRNRSDNSTITTGAQQALSHDGDGEPSISIHSGNTKDQRQQIVQPISLNLSNDRKIMPVISVSLSLECPAEVKDATSMSVNRETVPSSSLLKHQCSLEDATNKMSDVGEIVSASVATKVKCYMEVLPDTDHHHHISSSQEYKTCIHKEREREHAFSRSLCVVFLLMLVCLVPFGVVEIVDAISSQKPEVTISAALLLFLNNSVNWIVYGVMNRSFKQAYIQFLSRVMNKCGLRAAHAN